MILKYDKLTTSIEDLKELDRTNPYNVVGAFIQTIIEYDPKNSKDFYEKLQFLVGEQQELTEVMKQNIKDRMLQNDKYPYIGKSYFKGATPENDYTPQEPYELEIKNNIYVDSEAGFQKLMLKSGGADSERSIMLRVAKDNKYYIWSDSFMGLLMDIKQPESTNPWK